MYRRPLRHPAPFTFSGNYTLIPTFSATICFHGIPHHIWYSDSTCAVFAKGRHRNHRKQRWPGQPISYESPKAAAKSKILPEGMRQNTQSHQKGSAKVFLSRATTCPALFYRCISTRNCISYIFSLHINDSGKRSAWKLPAVQGTLARTKARNQSQRTINQNIRDNYSLPPTPQT